MVGRAREDDAWIVVVHLHALDDGLDRIAFAVEVVGNLLRLGEYQLVLLVVEDQHLLLPHLIDLAGDDLADLLRVFLVEAGFFEVEDARCEVLAQRQHGPAAERFEPHLIGVLVADLVGGVDGLHLRHGDLHLRILDRTVFHHDAVAPDFEVALLGVDDHVEVVVRLVLFLECVAEDVLQYADHRALVDVFQLFELCKRADKIQVIHGPYLLFYIIFLDRAAAVCLFPPAAAPGWLSVAFVFRLRSSACGFIAVPGFPFRPSGSQSFVRALRCASVSRQRPSACGFPPCRVSRSVGLPDVSDSLPPTFSAASLSVALLCLLLSLPLLSLCLLLSLQPHSLLLPRLYRCGRRLAGII